MVSLDDLKDLILYKKPFFLPIEPKNKKYGSAIFLLTPSYKSSILSMNKPYMVNKKYFESYYVEKDITRYIQNESVITPFDHGEYIFEECLDEVVNNKALYSVEKKSNLSNIYFNGEENDIMAVKPYIHKDDINACFRRMNRESDAPDKVTIIVTSDPTTLQEFTRDSVVIYTPSALKKLHPRLDYKDYIKFTLQLYAIYTIKAKRGKSAIHSDKVLDSFAEPAAIVLSGIADDEMQENKHGVLNVERVHKWIIDEYGIDEYMSILEYNDLNKFLKYANQYRLSHTNWTHIEESRMHEELKLLEAEAEAKSAPPAKTTAGLESIKKLKRMGTNIKRKIRWQTVHKMNMIRKDIDKSGGDTDPDNDGPSDNKSSENNNDSTDNNETEVKKEQLNDLTGNDYILEGNYVYLFEDSKKYNAILKKSLFKDRIKNNKQALDIYGKVKSDLPFIKYTYTDINRYKLRNLFVDLSYYNEAFFRNMQDLNTDEKSRSNKLRLFEPYIQLTERLLKDDKLQGYTKKTVFIPILEWRHNSSMKMWMYKEDANPISIIYHFLKTNPSMLDRMFGNKDVIFLGGRNYFKVNFSKTDFSNPANLIKFVNLIKRIIELGYDKEDPDGEEIKDSSSGIAMDIVDKVEKSQNVSIDDVSKISSIKKSGDEKVPTDPQALIPPDTNANNAPSEKEKKDAIVDSISRASNDAENVDVALKKLDNDAFKNMVLDLQNGSIENIRVDKMQASKVIEAQNEFHKKQLAGKSVKDLLSENRASTELPETSLKVASINQEWQHMTFMNFDKDYDLNADIVKMLDSMQYWSFPIAIKNIDIKDNSTSEDVVDLWSIECIDYRKHRFTLKVNIPKFLKGSNFLKLRGNEKVLMIQSTLLPIIKSGPFECQIIGTGGYNKIFVRKFGDRSGQSMPSTRNLMMALDRFQRDENRGIKIVPGNNKKICTKYNLPIDYIDMAQETDSIETPRLKIYFNQDLLRSKYTIDDTKGIPFAVQKSFAADKKKETETLIYFDGTKHNTMTGAMAYLLKEDNAKFSEIYDSIKSAGASCSYSKASILNKKIPVILICAYLEGLTTTLNKAGVNYSFQEKISSDIRYSDKYDYIKFNDGYLVYEVTYSSSLLLNGLKCHDTESYSISKVNDRMMYIDFFNEYGTFVESGLENSYDCMLDPITKEILASFKMPTDYVSVMIYANNLLADNKYVKHIDQSGRRWRRKELIAGYFYKVLTTAYQEYGNSLRNNRKGVKMSIKPDAIIDLITSKDPATTDLSINTALNDVECANTVTNKGLVGMNVSRGYTINTRGYDDSMINLLGMDTGFSGNVGINRQATINANVNGERGFVKTLDGDVSKLSSAATLTMTEAVTPLGMTHDDPQRTLMTYIQTSKHMMRCDNNDPTLITTGADEALPYLTSDIFAFKAKQDGKVIDIVQEGFNKQNYMIIEYKDKTRDIVDLSSHIKKNSDGGYFISLKLDTDLKKGNTFKAGDILAYDRLSFSNKLGESGNLAANIGTLTKIAIINTDEAFEDAAAVTAKFARRMGTDVVQEIETRLDKGANIIIYKDIGDDVLEGDTLFAYQADFDDEVANTLLKNLSIDDEQLSELGRNPVKTSYTGKVADIVIYRTCEMNEMSPSLQKFVKKYENKVNQLRKVYKANNVDAAFLPTADKVQPIGKTKGLDDGVLIIYYIQYNDKLSIGDKIVYYSANKGTIKYIIPDGQEPYTDFRPNEKIDSFMSLSSVSGRMTFSTVLFAAISKLMVELDRSVKDIAGIPYDETQV